MKVRNQFSAIVGKWERQTGAYQFGENYRIGKVIVGCAFYDGSASRNDPAKYAIELYLPSIKRPSDTYTNIEDAKARLERAVATWFRWLDEPHTA